MAKKKGKTATKKVGNASEIALILPILILTTLFLFCVRGRVVPSYLTDFFWYSGGEYIGDLYTYFRAQIFMIVTAVAVLYLLVCVFTGKVKTEKHKVYIPMVIYGVMVVVSYLLCEHKEIALMGYESRYEGTLVLLCYMLILFYSMHAVVSDKCVKWIMKGFSIACGILGIWGILQLAGVRLNTLPEWLYLPAEIREMGSLEIGQFTGAVDWFFSNQNYTSFFMIFPICLFAMMCIGKEGKKEKMIYAVLTGLMLFNLWQAASLGGMVGLAAAVIAALLLAGAENIKKWRKSIGLLVLAAVISVGASLPVIMREVESGTVTGDLLGLKRVYAEETSEEPLRFVKIEDIITDGEKVTFYFEEDEITISVKDSEIHKIVDGNGNELSDESDLMRAHTYLHEESGYVLLAVKTANRTWSFAIVEDNLYLVAPSGNLIKLDRVERIGFEGNEEFATNRGYIWSRTFPLLKETVLFGKGADTFAVYFPQDDFVGRYNIGYLTDAQNVIIDKPHNMYLGAAVNTGVISMLALVSIYVIYLIESVKTYRKYEFKAFKDYVGMGIAIAVAGFMVSGLVNDSTVQMMPVVYVLIGVGFAVNRMIRKEQANSIKE